MEIDFPKPNVPAEAGSNAESADVRRRRGFPVTREPALKPPLTGGPSSNVRQPEIYSIDEDLDIVEAGEKGLHALGAVAFAQGRSLSAVRRRYAQILATTAEELG